MPSDLKKLDKQVDLRIIDQLEATLSEDPGSGVLLTGQFEYLFRLRIGDYRVIYIQRRKMGYLYYASGIVARFTGDFGPFDIGQIHCDLLGLEVQM